jgi:hypothetical protein
MDQEKKKPPQFQEVITLQMMQYHLDLRQSYDSIKTTIAHHEVNIQKFDVFLSRYKGLETMPAKEQENLGLLGIKSMNSYSVPLAYHKF